MYTQPLTGFDSQTSPITDVHRRTILLVDDDPDIRSLTRTFLEHEGYRVLSCGNAERAGEIFRSAAPRVDLLITDMYMPQASGMELAQELKGLHKDLVVVLISGGIMDSSQLERLRAEGWRFLGKPFSLPELLGIVHQVLRAQAAA